MKGEDARAVVWSVLMAAQRARGKNLAEGLDLPGVPEGAWIGELPAMKARDVRGCVESIARVAGEAPEDLLEATTETARMVSVHSEIKAEQTELAIGFMRRERILPDEKTLEKIARYEAHPIQAALPLPARVRKSPEAEECGRGDAIGASGRPGVAQDLKLQNKHFLPEYPRLVGMRLRTRVEPRVTLLLPANPLVGSAGPLRDAEHGENGRELQGPEERIWGKGQRAPATKVMSTSG